MSGAGVFDGDLDGDQTLLGSSQVEVQSIPNLKITEVWQQEGACWGRTQKQGETIQGTRA